MNRAARLLRPERCLLALLAWFGLAAAWHATGSSPGIDFYQFWVVGQVLSEPDAEDVYNDAGRRRLGARFLHEAELSGDPRRMQAAEHREVLETYSTPFLYATFRLVSSGDYATDHRRHRALLLAGLAVAVVLLCRAARCAEEVALGAVAVFTLLFEPFSSDLRVGNVNSIQLLLLAAYLAVVGSGWGDAPKALGGAVLGVAVMFKPNLAFVVALLVAWWVVSAQLRTLRAHAIGGAAAVLLVFAFSAASFGSARAWSSWLSALRDMPDETISVELGNAAAARLIGDVLGFDAVLPLALASAALVLVGLWLARGSGRVDDAPTPELLVVAQGCLWMLIASPLAWLHYFVLTIPMLLLLLRPLRSSSPAAVVARRLLAVLALLLLAGTPLALVGLVSDAGRLRLSICLGALLLFAAGLWEFWALRKRKQREPGGSAAAPGRRAPAAGTRR